MRSAARDVYEQIVLGRPLATLVALGLITAALSWFVKDFALDASADSLILERDADLRYYRFVKARYGSDDYLIVTYTPDGALFSPETLADLRALRDALTSLPNVESVISILDVPLVNSPKIDLTNISAEMRYLENSDTDTKLAQQELISSPLYRDMIVNADSSTTALRVNMRLSEKYVALRTRRDSLREKEATEGLLQSEAAELADVTARFDLLSLKLMGEQRRDITAIRSVLDQHTDTASLHLGGVPMIVADSVDFIRHDLVVFGTAVLVFLVVILAIAFSKRRWIFLPLATCAATSVFMFGLLGRLGWRATVVSSNFVALLLILCLALTLHIIVRYREMHERRPDADQFTLVSGTIRSIVVPCFYTAITTVVAFGSLLVSGIRPVIDFGWMMSIGIVVAFVYAFTIFPAALMLLKPGQPNSRNDLTAAITRFFAVLIQRHGKPALLIFVLLFITGLSGITRLSVENRFIDYYKQSTEIYQGMALIDRELGGTTPLDVIIDAPLSHETDDADESLDDWFDYGADVGAGITAQSYWFNSRRIHDVVRIHDYLDGLPETGKVVSLASIAKILGELDPALLNDNFELSLMYGRLEPEVKDALFTPYLSDDGDQLRLGVRVFESDPTLRRGQLLDRIRQDLVNNLGIAAEQIHLTGMLVLYNNMLQSLFQSQILTLGAVFVSIVAMFLILFRSVKTAAVAIVPNLLSASLVLGIMGWFGIPLDLMTITIAAITVGIGVDDTIHYVHRFRNEFALDRDYWAAVMRCHSSIGRAIYYTSVTIMLGFSILAFSSFVPTIYFGLLTSLAMLVALLGNISLLPLLIVTFRTEGTPQRKAV